MTGGSPAPPDHLIATRLLKAAPDVVWRALTTPQHLAAFWGGRHATVPVDSVSVDLRVGGSFTVTTVGPTGNSHRLHFTYTEIDQPWRIGFTEPETGIITSIDLEPQGDRTLLTIHQRRVPPALVGEQARRGLSGILQQLDQLVAGLPAR